MPVSSVPLLVAGLLVAGAPDAGVRAEATPDASTASQEPFWQVVRDHLPQVNHCYTMKVGHTHSPDAGPVPGGTLKVQWTVLDGKVSSVKVLSKFAGANERFTSCVTDAIRAWRFPKRKAGQVVMSYPFVFLLQRDASRP